MTVKELIKAVNAANELNRLIGEPAKKIEVRLFKYDAYQSISTYGEYKKLMKKTIYEEFQSQYENPELIQESDYRNYFHNGETSIHIF